MTFYPSLFCVSGPGRIGWTEQDVETSFTHNRFLVVVVWVLGCVLNQEGVVGQPAQDNLAQLWKDEMPNIALDLVRNKRLASGAALVKLTEEYGRPTAKDSW